jgi:hypothetical protein
MGVILEIVEDADGVVLTLNQVVQVLDVVNPDPEAVVIEAINPNPSVVLTVSTGARGPAGADGSDGAQGPQGDPGQGVPIGGATGQVLAKNSGTDYDTEWVDAASGGGGGAVDSVNSQTGVVVLDQDDITDGTTAKQFLATEKTKLAGIATGATANDTDANLKARANHTGTQATSTIVGLDAALANTVTVATFTGHTGNTSNPHSVTKTQVGLGNVDNTADTAKPVSIAQQAALDGKTDIGHAHVATDITNFNTAVDARVQNIVGAAPSALDTLDELAAALGDDANFAATVTTNLAGKQPLDSDLTSIAGLTPADDDMLQRKAGVWTNRTMSQIKSDLSLTKADVGLSNVTNTSDADKLVSTLQQQALDLKADLASPTFTGTVAGITKSMVGLGSVDNTADTAKPISTATQTALDGKAATTVVPDGGATDYVLAKNSSTNRDTGWKRMLKWFGDVVTLPDSVTLFARVNIPDDASDTATWPDRLAFYFNSVRTGYFNEYGELRARPGKTNTVALRAFSHASGSSGEFFQLAKGVDSSVLVGSSETLFTSYIPFKATGGYQGVGAFRAVQSSAPSTTGWIAGELWYDTSTEV